MSQRLNVLGLATAVALAVLALLMPLATTAKTPRMAHSQHTMAEVIPIGLSAAGVAHTQPQMMAKDEVRRPPRALTPGNIDGWRLFGAAVAVDGNTTVIGAHRDDRSGPNSGSAYVYVHNGITWSEQAKLTASDGQGGAWFGSAVAVDGDTIVIGARRDNDNGTESGAVYVFTRNGTTWNEQAKLTASDAAAWDGFGISVAIDSDTLAIGAFQDDDNADDSGSVYIFTRNGTIWNEQAKLTASDAQENAWFGSAVAVDGETVVIGASYYGNNAYVFSRNGTTWSQQASLAGGAVFSSFGSAVAVDGDTIAIGANLDDFYGPSSGSVYVFVRTGPTWSQQQQINANDAQPNHFFGNSVTVHGDTMIIGAPGDDDHGGSSGTTYVFTRTGTTWSQQQKLAAGDGFDVNQFGSAVAGGEDMVVIGSPADNHSGGSAYVFAREGNDWSQQSKLPPAVPSPAGIYANYHNDGMMSAYHATVFGPDSCTFMGDPFSPLNSPWAPGYYTYTYRIHIPADYPEDIVRIELLDPDSINQAGATFTIRHSQVAVDHGFPLTDTRSCSASPQQQQFCHIETAEAHTLPFDEVNPFWFVRMDENRTGASSGCGMPGMYTPATNTQTSYHLYYETGASGSPLATSLARYTGQVGDGVRDDGHHLTDLQWVSPGAPVGLDQPAPVPTDCGSPNGGDYDPVHCPTGSLPVTGSGFEIDLTKDVPGIFVDPETGGRSLYLGVTTLSGASKNGFAVWAGPNVYATTITSDVNLRNIRILNHFFYDVFGVTVLAQDYLPLNQNTNRRLEMPLHYIDAAYAGKTVSVSLFDADSVAAPPIHFFFDTIPFDDWHVTYTGEEGGRCQIGACNNQWVTPPYTLTVPGDLTTCTGTEADSMTCVPFSGGRLMASYDGGQEDAYTWQVTMPEVVLPDYPSYLPFIYKP